MKNNSIRIVDYDGIDQYVSILIHYKVETLITKMSNALTDLGTSDEGPGNVAYFAWDSIFKTQYDIILDMAHAWDEEDMLSILLI